MSQAFLTSRALDDLEDIYRFIAKNSIIAAKRTKEALKSKCRFLAQFPGMGSQYPAIEKDIRRFPFGYYTIYYRIVDQGIEIVRVYHPARSMENFDENV